MASSPLTSPPAPAPDACSSSPCFAPSWDPHSTSKAKLILLNDHWVPEVRVVPKEKHHSAAVLGMAHFLHLP